MIYKVFLPAIGPMIQGRLSIYYLKVQKDDRCRTWHSRTMTSGPSAPPFSPSHSPATSLSPAHNPLPQTVETWPRSELTRDLASPKLWASVLGALAAMIICDSTLGDSVARASANGRVRREVEPADVRRGAAVDRQAAAGLPVVADPGRESVLDERLLQKCRRALGRP